MATARHGSTLLAAALLPCFLDAAVVDYSLETIDAAPEIGSFIKFYAPWCGHCKRLSPAWNELGDADLGSDVHIGRVDCTRQIKLRERFRISGYPTLLFVAPAKEAGAPRVIHKYSGSRSLDSLSAFAKGGWRDAEVYDPAALPPPKKKTKKWWLPWLLGAIAVIILISFVYVLITAEGEAKPLPPEQAEALGPAWSPEAKQGRTFGNTPLSTQSSSKKLD